MLLAAVAAGLFVTAVPLAVIDVAGGHGKDTGEFIIAGFAPGFIIAGLMVARRRPELAVGWLYVTGGITSAGAGLSAAYAGSALAHGWPGASWALWVTSWTWFCHDTCAAVAILVFPEGRPLSQRRRWLVVVPLVAIAVAVMLTMVQPGGITITPGTAVAVRRMANPLGTTALPVLRLLRNIALILAAVVTTLGALVLIVVRFFRSKGALRAQLRWLAVVVVAGALVPPTVAIANIAVTLLGQVVVTTAIVRRGALGIDVVLRRSVLAAALLVTALGSYLAGVAVVGAAVGRSGPVVSAVAATAAVFAFAPLSVQVRRRVDQLFYGRRSQPYAVVAAVGRRLGDAPTPEEGLETLVVTLSEELRVPFVEVTAGSGEVLASRGTPERGDEPIAFDLTHQANPVGRLRVGHRRGEPEIGAAEATLLGDLARQVGAAVHAVAVVANLRRARERLVVAREDERRRLQRDLHDGLGPRLTAVAYTIDAARNRLPAETSTAAELLRQSSGEALAGVAEVRRLVYALGDPVLYSLGLVGAVRDQASRFPSGETQVEIEVRGEDVDDVPAAVEVAAYRIASEAMTNAIRHAHARHCLVTIANCDEVLRVSVCDDGTGLPIGWKPGVGMRSMHDRAAEVGGAIEISDGPDGGVLVEALLPVHGAEHP